MSKNRTSRAKSQPENTLMNDGSRCFATFPESQSWSAFAKHIASLPGAEVAEFLTDEVTEVWIDFDFKSNRFTVNNQFGEYWLSVDDPKCPDEILVQVSQHCAKSLS